MKTEEYSDRQIRVAQLSKALGHPARVAIIEFLLKQDSCVCGDIVEALPLSQSTVSQHLSALKKAELIQGTISGPSVCYCLNHATWNTFSEELGLFFKNVEQLNCC